MVLSESLCLEERQPKQIVLKAVKRYFPQSWKLFSIRVKHKVRMRENSENRGKSENQRMNASFSFSSPHLLKGSGTQGYFHS